MEGLEKTMRTLRMGSVPAEIGREHPTDTSPEGYRYINSLRFWHV
jgi:hypothetical protein